MADRSNVRESLIALGVVLALLAILFAWSRTWPPAVIVESGSMMHPHEARPYGRFGTIDPGDLVLVQKVSKRSDVALETDGGRSHYAKPGDVIVYARNGDGRDTPIIHRAITWVDVVGNGSSREYRLWWKGEWKSFDASGIAFPELGFDRDHVCCPTGKFKPRWSGFITQGDNPFTNKASDQAIGISRDPVPLEWVRGEAHAEVPWIGLLKLAIAPTQNDYNAAWWRVGNAYAPRDCWIMLGVSLAVAVAAPFGVDATRRAVRRAREKGERER